MKAGVDHPGLSALYGAGTDKAPAGNRRALNRRFSKNRRRRRSLNDEADELAATGDVDAAKDQFGKVGKTCKSCHDK
jgi:cytochrome c556